MLHDDDIIIALYCAIANRPLSQRHLEVVDSSNEIESEAEALASVAVAV